MRKQLTESALSDTLREMCPGDTDPLAKLSMRGRVVASGLSISALSVLDPAPDSLGIRSNIVSMALLPVA